MEKEAQDGGRTEKRHGQKVASERESDAVGQKNLRNAEKKMRRDPEEFLKYGSGK